MTTIDALKYNEDERVRQSGLWYCRFYQNRIDICMIAYEHVSALKFWFNDVVENSYYDKHVYVYTAPCLSECSETSHQIWRCKTGIKFGRLHFAHWSLSGKQYLTSRMSCSWLRKYLAQEGIEFGIVSVDLFEVYILNGETVRNEKSWNFKCPTKWYACSVVCRLPE